MIRHRVTILTRDTGGLEYASIHGPFDWAHDAEAFAAQCRRENTTAAVDVITYDDQARS